MNFRTIQGQCIAKAPLSTGGALTSPTPPAPINSTVQTAALKRIIDRPEKSTQGPLRTQRDCHLICSVTSLMNSILPIRVSKATNGGREGERKEEEEKKR